ncbi:hypothetical protein D9M68_597530 [compost metagenome]
MLVPLAMAVPWLAAVPTATEVAAPPVMFSVTGVAAALYATVSEAALATGGTSITVIAYDWVAV